MPKKRFKYDNGRITRITHSDQHVVKIDKIGEKYVVTSPLKKRGFLLRPSKIKFALYELDVVARVENELEKVKLSGGKIFITHRALGVNDGDDGGVWPPFVSSKLKGSIKILKIKK